MWIISFDNSEHYNNLEWSNTMLGDPREDCLNVLFQFFALGSSSTSFTRMFL
jgi:hypothetical protein